MSRIANPEMFQILMGHQGVSLTPRQYEIAQWWFYSPSEPRAMQLLGGERAGKSLLTSTLISGSIDPLKKGTVWLVGPDYWQARPEFQYLYEMYSAAGLVKSAHMPSQNNQQWTMELHSGLVFMTRSSYEKKKLASFKVNGAAMVEAGQQEQEVMTKLLGRVSETRGFLILTGTIEEGMPWYEDLYQRWQAENALNAKSWSLPTWSNTYVFPGGREDPEIKMLEAETPPDIFLERYAAVPRRKYGRVLPEFEMETHVRKLDYDPLSGPVELAIDPAKHTYAILFVQHVGPYTHVLDRVYKHGIIAEEIIPLAISNPFWKYVELENAGVMDIAGKHEDATYSQIQIWKSLCGAVIRPGRYQYRGDTIEVLRSRLGTSNIYKEPLIYFNSHITNQTSSDGKLAMDILAEPFLWKWPQRSSGQGNPKYPIDKNNDAMKALAYKLVDRYGTVPKRSKKEKKKRQKYWLASDSMSKAAKTYANNSRTYLRQSSPYGTRASRIPK